jgi:predicted short-subunit dehydrogenase-like oxidoreductase (DUF2520 family)
MTKITMIGAGNLATHISRALQHAGHEIIQVFSRTEKSASHLANQLDCPFTTDLNNIIKSELAIIAVKDDAIKEVEKHINFPKVHTSGTKNLDCLTKSKVGVFYPLQTFSKTSNVDFESVPICIESNDSSFYKLLNELANSITNKVYMLDSKQRRQLHIAAVIACNFSNLMYRFSEDICKEHSIPFEILQPLILETANKIQSLPPSKAQTGPAQRGDELTIEKHIASLDSNSELQSIYKTLSNSIKKHS